MKEKKDEVIKEIQKPAEGRRRKSCTCGNGNGRDTRWRQFARLSRYSQ